MEILHSGSKNYQLFISMKELKTVFKCAYDCSMFSLNEIPKLTRINEVCGNHWRIEYRWNLSTFSRDLDGYCAISNLSKEAKAIFLCVSHHGHFVALSNMGIFFSIFIKCKDGNAGRKNKKQNHPSHQCLTKRIKKS